jgi:histidine ammonia-lyase
VGIVELTIEFSTIRSKHWKDSKVPFLDHDRSMTPDIAAGAAFLKVYTKNGD